MLYNKISVIVPVYNVDKYIKQCLNSILNQSLKEIEIICVNDGSTDNSLNILQEFAQKDSRITIINQENKGVSAARNKGIEVAKGKYIMFFDGDDYYCENTAFEKVYNVVENENTDIGIFGFSHLVKNKIEASSFYEKFIEAEDGFEANNYLDYPIHVHDKIFRKNFLQENNIKFNEKLKNSEDLIFAIECYLQKPTYSFIPEVLYIYRQDRPNSAINSNSCAIKNDAAAFMELYKLKNFKKQPLSFQLKVVNRFLNVAVWYAEKFGSTFKQVNDTKIISEFVEEKYAHKDLKKLSGYKELKKYQNKFIKHKIKNFMQTIFSVRNSRDKSHKQIKILGLKLNVSRRFISNLNSIPESQEFIQTVFKSLQNSKDTTYRVPYLPQSNGNVIVFSCDNDYCKYFAVALQSLIENSSTEKFYDIVLLIDNITARNERLLTRNLPENISLRFISIEQLIEGNHNTKDLYVGKYWNINTFYRLFIPLIFSDYKRAIYLDSDIVIEKNIDELFDITFENNELIGAKDDVAPVIYINPKCKHRLHQMKDILKLDNPENYINAGICIFNLSKIDIISYVNKCMAALNITALLFNDQDILNTVFQNKIKFMHLKYNFEWHIPNLCEKDIQFFTGSYKTQYFEALNSPAVIHFTSGYKPWNTPNMDFADYFWKYARLTPYYEEIIHSNTHKINENTIKNLYLSKKIKSKYLKSKILSFLSFGKTKRKYKNQRNALKTRITEIRKYAKL